MICHQHKIIFIHIPKCAGSSIEEYFGVKPFKWKYPNYENLTGWCPKRKIHLHHATAEQLLNTGLVKEEDWDSYFKFAIIRNPWSRAVSDYYWFNRSKIIKTGFSSYLKGEGRLKKEMTNKDVKEYRGDHLLPQCDFIKINNKIVVDKIIRLENLKEEFGELKKELNLPKKALPHSKKANKHYDHYSEFYFDKEIEMIRDKYKKDIQEFNYHFEDKRNKNQNDLIKYINRRFLK